MPKISDHLFKEKKQQLQTRSAPSLQGFDHALYD
jgi:hypothetical protein